MNPKQTIPLAVALAPVIAAAPAVIIGGVIGLGVVWLIKNVLDSDKIPAAETDPAKTELESSRKTAEKPVFREIPAIPLLSVAVPSVSRVSSRPSPVPSVSVAPVTVQAVTPAVRAVSQLVSKKIITRADMATIFENGKKSLSRIAAVAELKRHGFGKSAAYSATSPDGRFSAWLVFASDGIIHWAENGQKPEIP